MLLDRLAAGRSEQSMLVTGLRGVGKTVLLNEFRALATDAKWAVVELEVTKHDDSAFRRVLGRAFRRALLEIAPLERWRERARRAAGVLRAFTVSVDADGKLIAGLGDVEMFGVGDSGDLDADLTDLMVEMGEAAKDHETGVVLLVDEVQFLQPSQLEAVVMALHRTVRRRLPITLVGAGLPQLAELAGEAKSYSERLFRFPAIGKLAADDARAALRNPARQENVVFEEPALDLALEFTEGYPYFLQELGYAVWAIAQHNIITREDVHDAQRVVEDKLDGSFFRVRLDRTTELEKVYLRAIAELGPEPQLAGDVARLLHRTSQQCGPTRATLVEKGLLYTPSYGFAAFTVPQFDQFMRRHVPELVVPPVRSRRAKSR